MKCMPKYAVSHLQRFAIVNNSVANGRISVKKRPFWQQKTQSRLRVEEGFFGPSRVQNRGPDAHSTILRPLPCELQAAFSGFTLHFQGELTPQPLCSSTDGSSNILLWNGEIFSGIETGDANDGLVLLRHLNNCQSDSAILSVLATIHGPWAFVFWQESEKKLWFGRDVFGRRSLLYHHSSENKPCFVLSSVATENQLLWKEVPAKGIYVIDFSAQNSEKISLVPQIKLYTWIVDKAGTSLESVQEIEGSTELFHQKVENVTDAWQDLDILQSNLGVKVPFTTFNDSVTNAEVWINDSSKAEANADELPSLQVLASPDQLVLSEELIEVLGTAVKLRVENQSYLCHQCITAALKSQQASSSRNSHSDLSCTTVGTSHSKEADIPRDVKENTEVSRDSGDKCTQKGNFEKCNIGTRTVYTEADAGQCSITSITTSTGRSDESQLHVKLPLLSSGNRCGHARVGILYSGGIDSLVLAALADRVLPPDEPIDLLNVAFEQKKSEGNKSKRHSAGNQKEIAETNCFEVPDRITGRDGLKQLNSNRKWNFVEINITVAELQAVRAEHVKKLVYPLNTVLDDSIGCAIWFAARGQGVINNGDQAVPHTTTARVLLVGMGADEQLVGYSRHRVKYKTDGLIGLVNEIQLEIERISARNLGRDDRVISDHSRESRFPFLDEDVVSFLNKLPVTQKVNLELPRGIGDKFLLRLAAEKLGLTKSCTLEKRAIQFGSRIAKCENKKEKGSDICKRL